ncbi:MAG: DUF2088 domain-containing protein [Chlorobi bacterium]|nr:DUF2088 domain-containing protein [Chlorobiota bacterium]
MIYFEKGSEKAVLSNEDLENGLYTALDRLGRKRKVLAIPPDITRLHSRAGEVTRHAWEYFGNTLTDILPALGTHSPMSPGQLQTMFGDIPLSLFREHNWRKDVVTLGQVSGEFIHEITEGKLSFDWPAQVNRLLKEGGYDLILSPGQVVPHEVIGMANYNKNIFIGTGGAESINKSHFVGAVYGMERIMGRAENPVRAILNKAEVLLGNKLPPVLYVLTVIGLNENDRQVTRGLFIGDDIETFRKAAELSVKVNIQLLDKPLEKVVVYLDPAEYKSTWLGNKAIYRTRMALADDGELIILAPGLKEFGEDKEIDRLIRKYGYHGTDYTLDQVKKNRELAENLAAAAHLIHGSSEGRFNITYCPGHLSKEEIEKAGFIFADLTRMQKKYDITKMEDGFNILPDGEEIFYISNPALGLWAEKKKFSNL